MKLTSQQQQQQQWRHNTDRRASSQRLQLCRTSHIVGICRPHYRPRLRACAAGNILVPIRDVRTQRPRMFARPPRKSVADRTPVATALTSDDRTATDRIIYLVREANIWTRRRYCVRRWAEYGLGAPCRVSGVCGRCGSLLYWILPHVARWVAHIMVVREPLSARIKHGSEEKKSWL